MRKIDANGFELPAIGQGGWTLGDVPMKRREEIYALRYGIELGMNMIDTAEMYGEGASELLIGEAIRGIDRDNIILVSKVFPYNSGSDKIFDSCDGTLRRLGVDYVDLYLLHWREDYVNLEETVECMEELILRGKIRRWGVSNFDESDMAELWKTPGGDRCAVDQVMYNVGSRGIEFDLLPWAKERSVGIMAYEPLLQAGQLKRMHPDVMHDETLESLAEKYGVSTAQIMLAFTIRSGSVSAIPKATSAAHVTENSEAANILLTEDDIGRIDAVFWPPSCKMHLDID